MFNIMEYTLGLGRTAEIIKDSIIPKSSGLDIYIPTGAQKEMAGDDEDESLTQP